MDKVGCETKDGLLNVHPVDETCEVCSDPAIEGEVPKILKAEYGSERGDGVAPKAPKHKHFFAPGYETCQCGAQRCTDRTDGNHCKGICLKDSNVCRKHNKI